MHPPSRERQYHIGCGKGDLAKYQLFRRPGSYPKDNKVLGFLTGNFVPSRVQKC